MNIALLAAATVAGVCGFSIMHTALDLTVPPPDVRRLSVAQLTYATFDGKGAVTQQIKSESGAPIPGAWVARIERPTENMTELICDGDGTGTYEGVVQTWDLDTWTNDDCPDAAQPGDIFEVSWTYDDEFGWPITIGGRFRLTPMGDLVREPS